MQSAQLELSYIAWASSVLLSLSLSQRIGAPISPPDLAREGREEIEEAGSVSAMGRALFLSLLWVAMLSGNKARAIAALG